MRCTFAAVVAAAVLAGCAAPTTTQPISPPTVRATGAVQPPPVTATAPKTAGIGDPVRDGKLTFTVTKAMDGPARLGDQFASHEPQGRFFFVYVTVSNHATEAQTFVASAQKLVVGNVQYSADDKAGIYLKDLKSAFTQVNPGNVFEGLIVYDIPKAVKPEAIEFHDSPFSGGVKVAL